jgi:hypothetical protein
MNETKKMKGFLRGFLMGFLVLPAALGLLVIFHVLIDSKSDGRGGEITNRIARAELIWLAMNKPKLFCESFDWVCEDVQEHHEKDR